MNTKKKRFVTGKRLIYRRFLALTLAGSLLLPGLVLIRTEKAEASIIVDMASGVVGKLRYTTTVAEIVVSLLTGSGASITNTNWLNQLNSAYGINSTLATATGTDGTIGAMYEAGLFSIDNAGHFIDNGLAQAIRSQSAYTDLGLENFFTTTNADLELGAWQTADAAQNLGEAAAAGITLGTLGQAVGAVALGVSLGVLANKVATYIGDKMASGASIDMPSNIPTGFKVAYSFRTQATGRYKSCSWLAYLPVNCECIGYTSSDGNSTVFNIVNPSSENIWYKKSQTLVTADSPTFPEPTSYSTLLANNYASTNVQGGIRTINSNIGTDSINVKWVNDANSLESYRNGLLNGDITASSPYSPDVIGPNGNQKPNNYNNPRNITSWPDLHPPEELQDENTGIQPIPWQDYIDQADVYNDNTVNNNTTIEQGDTYNNFVTNYITNVTTIPDVETPDFSPSIPQQPQPNEKEELTTEDIQDTTDYMTTPGLKDVFPFSIPWDIAGLFNVFSTNNREAPVITFPIVSEMFGIDEEVTIDLSPFDNVASLLRLLELIAFGIGLAFVTRYLIGAGG